MFNPSGKASLVPWCGAAGRRVGWSSAAPRSVSGVGGQRDCQCPLCLLLTEEEKAGQHVFQPTDDLVS